MNEDEQNYYGKLTSTQKSMVDALKNIGFTLFAAGIYQYETGYININKMESWSDLLTQMYALGIQHNQQQVKNVLGIS